MTDHDKEVPMKFHRVLLFTSIQMDITSVGDDLHVLMTAGDQPYLACTTLCKPVFSEEEEDTVCDVVSRVITDEEDPSPFFCSYVADRLCRKTGKNVLVTGGICVPDQDERMTDKLYENIDEMIMDWVNFLTD